MNASRRQRARRALKRLGLSPGQAESVVWVARDQGRQLDAARALLDECRRQLRAALGAGDEPGAILELSVQERLLEGRARDLEGRLEAALAAILRPEQARRLRGLPRPALGDLLERLSA